MFSNVFLAQTGGEPEEFSPGRMAYMAVHFSAYGAGLSNLPQQLPKGSILLLDDSTPPSGHDPQTVITQLKELAESFAPTAILLDFQRGECAEAYEMAKAIIPALPCPVAVTEPFARKLGCPVFLAPPPVNKPLKTYLQPWLKNGIYLEIAPEALEITVTEDGSRVQPVMLSKNAFSQADKRLHCHYRVEVFRDKAVFSLQRDKRDLADLVQEAYAFGVKAVVGLYQELHGL